MHDYKLLSKPSKCSMSSTPFVSGASVAQFVSFVCIVYVLY